MIRLNGESLKEQLTREADELEDAIKVHQRRQEILKGREHWQYMPDRKLFKRNREIIEELKEELGEIKERLARAAEACDLT